MYSRITLADWRRILRAVIDECRLTYALYCRLVLITLLCIYLFLPHIVK